MENTISYTSCPAGERRNPVEGMTKENFREVSQRTPFTCTALFKTSFCMAGFKLKVTPGVAVMVPVATTLFIGSISIQSTGAVAGQLVPWQANWPYVFIKIWQEEILSKKLTAAPLPLSKAITRHFASETLAPSKPGEPLPIEKRYRFQTSPGGCMCGRKAFWKKGDCWIKIIHSHRLQKNQIRKRNILPRKTQRKSII